MAKNAILLISGAFAHLHTYTHHSLCPLSPLAFFFLASHLLPITFFYSWKKYEKKIHRMRDGEREERLIRGREEGIGVSIFLYIKYNFICAFPCSVRSLSFVVSHFSFHLLYIFFSQYFYALFFVDEGFFFVYYLFFFLLCTLLAVWCATVCVLVSLNFFYIIIIEGWKKTFKLCHIHSRIFFSHLNLHSVLYIFFV